MNLAISWMLRNMAHFQYSGRDSSGALVSGQLDAGSADDAATMLFGNSVTPIEISETTKKATRKKAGVKEKKEGNVGALKSNATAVEKINDFLGANKIETDDLIRFSRQMYSLTKAGLPLDRAIKGLEATLTNKKFKAVLRDVVAGLENGTTLATALGQHPKVFSNLFLSLVHVGENTGQLDLAFTEIGKYLQLEKETNRQVKSATRYPTFVLVAMAAALAVISVFVIPVFSGVFEALGADLPWQTQVLIGMSDFVINYWPIIIIAIGSTFFGVKAYVKTEKGLLNWDKRKLGRTFSMVLGAGMPIVQSLNVVAGAVGNTYIASNILKMREGVERGESLFVTATNSRMFSPLVLQMISVGEETGNVDDLLSEVADFYDAEVEYDIQRLGASIEPILIVFIAGLVLILALGVFLPLWDLNSAAN